jgi:hypothetical protein
LFLISLLGSHPELYFVAQTHAGALSAGHMNLAIFEQVPARRLMDDQGMGLYNLNPARGGSSAFRILLNNGGDAYEFEYQIIGDFVGRKRINRIDQHFDVCHALEISKGTKYYQH